MERLGLGLLAATLGIVLLMLLTRTWRADRARRVAREAYLDACLPLLDGARTGTGSTGFPRLSGRYRNVAVDVQAVPDTLTFRKLPALWVLVTVTAPMPLRATFDVMIRPTGVEPFSNFHLLPEQIALPPGFPDDCALRTDDATLLPPVAMLRPHLALFDDPRVKELLLTPKGLRITFLAEEANRGRYLIFRDAEMGQDPLPPQRLVPVLDALLDLRTDVLALAAPDRGSRSA